MHAHKENADWRPKCTYTKKTTGDFNARIKENCSWRLQCTHTKKTVNGLQCTHTKKTVTGDLLQCTHKRKLLMETSMHAYKENC